MMDDPSDHGQMAMREVIMSYLQRVEHDVAGSAVRLYPFTRGEGRNAPKLIVIDPQYFVREAGHRRLGGSYRSSDQFSTSERV